MAISEVIWVIPDVDLANFLKFGKKNARAKLENRFVELARLKKRSGNDVGFEKCFTFGDSGRAERGREF